MTTYAKYRIFLFSPELTDGKFLRVQEIRVKADFRSVKQKIATGGFLDVDDLYKE